MKILCTYTVVFFFGQTFTLNRSVLNIHILQGPHRHIEILSNAQMQRLNLGTSYQSLQLALRDVLKKKAIVFFFVTTVSQD